jgi:hypothetical protein
MQLPRVLGVVASQTHVPEPKEAQHSIEAAEVCSHIDRRLEVQLSVIEPVLRDGKPAEFDVWDDTPPVVPRCSRKLVSLFGQRPHALTVGSNGYRESEPREVCGHVTRSAVSARQR